MFGKVSVAALLFFALTAWGEAAAYSSPTFEQGLRQYNAGRYRHAAIYFTMAIEEDPTNALTHYYLADALVRTGHHDQAIEEYAICYRISPAGRISDYCRRALTGYRQPLPEKVAGAGDTTGGGGQAGSSNVVRPVSDEAWVIARAKSHIRREAAYEKSKHHQSGECFALGAIAQAETEAGRIQDEASRDIEAAMQPPVMVIGRMVRQLPVDPELVRQRVEEIRQRAAERTETARRRGQVRADHYKQISRERQTALDEVVANLETQLEQPVSHSGVKLQPVGTDLYTRFYGTLRASNQLPDVHPAVVRIIDRPTSIRSPHSDPGPAEFQESSRPRPAKIVRGTVLH